MNFKSKFEFAGYGDVDAIEEHLLSLGFTRFDDHPLRRGGICLDLTVEDHLSQLGDFFRLVVYTTEPTYDRPQTDYEQIMAVVSVLQPFLVQTSGHRSQSLADGVRRLPRRLIFGRPYHQPVIGEPRWGKIDSKILTSFRIKAETVGVDTPLGFDWDVYLNSPAYEHIRVAFLFDVIDPVDWSHAYIPGLQVTSRLGNIYSASGTIITLAVLSADANVISIG